MTLPDRHGPQYTDYTDYTDLIFCLCHTQPGTANQSWGSHALRAR